MHETLAAIIEADKEWPPLLTEEEQRRKRFVEQFKQKPTDTCLDHFINRCLRTMVRSYIRALTAQRRGGGYTHYPTAGPDAIDVPAHSNSLYSGDNPSGHRPDQVVEDRQLLEEFKRTICAAAKPDSRQYRFGKLFPQIVLEGLSNDEIAAILQSKSPETLWARALAALSKKGLIEKEPQPRKGGHDLAEGGGCNHPILLCVLRKERERSKKKGTPCPTSLLLSIPLLSWPTTSSMPSGIISPPKLQP